ncbi:PilT/PilU family type 4a pilus ATPase [Enterovibrio sp. ZSDZ35]|uniref:PilT/PilU family type 4a pilus ATPase n=1 Tax=Enterovibrio qingdaonensis TaxID=2899818 RepID=A0ABT5QPB9_9GAMM|nr:PilT/PilU family type 4a pilus ATPase [Enterovibrio sp. ZSDZ35]
MELTELLRDMMTMRASDGYITVGAPSMLRVDGSLKPIGDALNKGDVESLVQQAMGDERYQNYLRDREANFALMTDAGRFRVSAFWQRDLPGMVVRRIETQIPAIHTLGLPGVMQDLAIAKRGLILIVGATGSGKSTSMAAMVGFRNNSRSGHILTVEDPIEFIHPHNKCIVTQREIGIDTESYEVALKNSLRQAPDMIMIGEIRSRETMEYAMQFAETGHLCIATLHANNANQALERVLHLVPKERREQFLFDLSLNLKAVLAQQLIPDISGIGRHGAYELLLNTSNVSDLIRRGELHELKECIQKGTNAGMCTFDQSLFELFKNGHISKDEALHHADSRNELKLMMKMNEQVPTTSSSMPEISIEGR